MGKNEKDWIEEIRVRGAEAVDRIKDLVAEGNVRKIVLKKENDEVLFELPLTAGVLAGGVVTLMAPVIAAIGAAAAFLAQVKIEIHRDGDGSDEKKPNDVVKPSDESKSGSESDTSGD